jgi:hypothetical protein
MPLCREQLWLELRTYKLLAIGKIAQSGRLKTVSLRDILNKIWVQREDKAPSTMKKFNSNCWTATNIYSKRFKSNSNLRD